MTGFEILLPTVSMGLMLRPACSWAQAESNRANWDHMPMMRGGAWLGMIFGPLFMILALAAAVAVVVLVIRWLGGPSLRWNNCATPMPRCLRARSGWPMRKKWKRLAN